MKIKGIEGLSGKDVLFELQQGGKFVTYQYCISLLVVTFKRPSPVYLIRSTEKAVTKGLLYSLISFFLGWWGIPWGPIYTIESFVVNFKGGRDVTAQITAALSAAANPAAQTASPLDGQPIYTNKERGY